MENRKMKICLTFDDGPSPFTLQILDVLKKFNVKATFFVCGKCIENYPEIAKRIVKEGHKIGNHTFSHSFFLSLSGLLKEEIEKTEEIIYKVTNVKTKLFRPPWGILRPWLKKFLKEKGYKIILWDVNSYDWLQIPAKLIEKMVLKKVKENSILLFHDGCHGKKCSRSQTVIAISSIIKELKKRNCSFEVF
jgi:peptidoglycan/xylan/chitin deacetylase (PgdA/CDA1 family)